MPRKLSKAKARAMGQNRSEAKRTASRLNGALGGRPKGSGELSEATKLAQSMGISRTWAYELLRRKAGK